MFVLLMKCVKQMEDIETWFNRTMTFGYLPSFLHLYHASINSVDTIDSRLRQAFK